MNYYAHGVSDNRWIGDNFYSLKGETITIDLQCANNEWSTYLVKDINDEDLLDRIALQYFADCNNKIETSVALALFSSSFLKKHGLKEPDESDYGPKGLLNVSHCNIRSENGFLKVQCIIDVGKELFDVFNTDREDPTLLIRFYGPLKMASIIKKNKDAFRGLMGKYKDRIDKMITFFDSIRDEELKSFLVSIKGKKGA